MNQQEAKKIEKNIINTLNLFVQNGDTVIAAISGGPDSVFLLHMLKKLPLNIIIAHVNHHLRGKDSQKDSDFVANLSQPHTFALKNADITKISKTLKRGLEETGRIVRYKFFNDLAKKHEATYILTAHHADDNLETILLNLTRGASLKGLAGMKIADQKLLRPLLEVSKEQIIRYLKLNKIAYRTDATNKKTVHSRNFIRHKVIPELKKLNPSLTETVAKNSAILRKTADYIQEKSEKYLKKILMTTDTDSESVTLNAKDFRNLPDVLKQNVMRQCYKKLVGNTENIELKHLEEILLLIANNIGNKSKKFGKCVLTLENNIIGLKKSPKK